MATLRTHPTVKRPVEDVWSVVSDAGAISAWFPLEQTSTLDGTHRHCQLIGGVLLQEDAVRGLKTHCESQ